MATTTEPVGTVPRTIEVYPHPAVLKLLGRDYRVPYKVGRSTRYWPGADRPARIRNLLAEMGAINAALGAVFGDTRLMLPEPSFVPSLASLKKYEDALDALICAWIGVSYVERTAVPYGDETAAIWVPQ